MKQSLLYRNLSYNIVIFHYRNKHSYSCSFAFTCSHNKMQILQFTWQTGNSSQRSFPSIFKTAAPKPPVPLFNMPIVLMLTLEERHHKVSGFYFIYPFVTYNYFQIIFRDLLASLKGHVSCGTLCSDLLVPLISSLVSCFFVNS